MPELNDTQVTQDLSNVNNPVLLEEKSPEAGTPVKPSERITRDSIPEDERDEVAPNAISVPWRFLVPQAAAGPIVGKAGENLKRLVASIEPTARLDVTRDGELTNIEDKMVSIRASSADKKTEMARYVLQKVKIALNLPKDQTVGFVLAIPQSAIAAIIGQKGEKIRDIIETSGCEKIDVPKQASFGSDYAIRVIGTEEATLDATKRVYQVVQEIANRSRLSERDFIIKPSTTSNLNLQQKEGPLASTIKLGAMQVTHTLKFLLNRAEASWTIGRGGNVIRELRGNSGATFDLYDLNDKDRVVEVGGLYQFKLTGVELLLKSLENCTGRANSVTMLIPQDKVGAVIGKAGQTIQEIARQSSCRIDVDKNPVSIVSDDDANPHKVENNPENDDYRKVVMKGTYDQMRLGCQLICQKVEEASTDRRAANNIGANLDPEQPNNVRLLLTKEEVGWAIGKGGRVMKDIRKTSGASTWIKEGEEAYPCFDQEKMRVVEVQGRLEATLTCLDMMMRVNEKFSGKQQHCIILCPTYQTAKLGVDRIGEMAKCDVSLGEIHGEYKLINVQGHDDKARRAAILVALKMAEFAARV